MPENTADISGVHPTIPTPPAPPPNGVIVPDYVWKALSGVISAAVIALGAWVWNVQNCVRDMQHDLNALETRTTKVEACLEATQQNTTQIEVIKTELGYIKQGIGDIKEILSKEE